VQPQPRIGLHVAYVLFEGHCIMGLRLGILALAALLLTGCADGDWAHLNRYESPLSDPTGATPTAMPEAAVAPAAVSYRQAMGAQDPSVTLCARTADERATDAERQGFEDAVRKAVHDKTYADCMTWKGPR
jgi:hypothetical protein